MKNKRIVITGIGVLSPTGIGRDTYWQRLKEGRSGIKNITVFDTARFKVKIGGEITEFNPKEILGRTGLVDLDRATTLLSCAMKFALEDSGLVINESNKRRIGISVGTMFGSLNSLWEFDKTCLIQGPKCVNPSRFPNTVVNSPASRAAIRFGIKGFNTTISSGFCAGADALDYAVHALRFNRAEQVLAGAVEEMSFPIFLWFYQLGYLSGLKDGAPAVSRPFDNNRDGIVFAEASSVILLETLEAALKRKAKIYAEIVSVASNFDPGGFHKFNKRAEGMIKAMESAINTGGLEKEDIDCIFANANSTKDSDAIETKAIKGAFGKYAQKIPVTAIKSMIGETFSSSGAMNLAAALGSLERGFIPAITNYQTKDKACDLKLVLQTLENIKLHHIMVNCFDPSGANTVIILKQFRAR
jgi:3-oxoacyl-[acyl-carrier-protein] synthase II